MRSPASRHPGSPALAVLREILHPGRADRPSAWVADRLAAGGVVRETAASPDLRRALPLLERRWRAAGAPRGGLPPDERACLAAARLASAVRAQRARATLLPLGAAASRRGIAPLLLKGLALHGTLYPDPALRPVSDVDLYVPPAAFASLRAALSEADLLPDRLTAARLEAYDASGGREARLSDFVFRRADAGGGPGLPIEAKLDPVQLGLPLRRGQDFARGAVPSSLYAGFLVPAAEPMAVQQALHLARHDGSDLVWFAEVAAVLARAGPSFDVGLALSLVDGEGLEGTLREVWRATEDLFPGTVPAACLRARAGCGITAPRFRVRTLRSAPPDEVAATWSLQAVHAISARRPVAVLSALARRIWPHHAYLAARLGLPPGSPVGCLARLRRLSTFPRLRAVARGGAS